MQRVTPRWVYRICLQHHCRWLQPTPNLRWPRPSPFHSPSYATTTTTAHSRRECPPTAEIEADEQKSADDAVNTITANPRLAVLPVTCPGCGALSSDVDPAVPGYYSRTRKSVKYWFRAAKRQDVSSTDGAGDDSQVKADSSPATLSPELVVPPVPPVCDRCHDLLHNAQGGTSIAHPRIEDIADSIAESPFSRNHVYHVLDAADFPMSLVPSIISRLSLARPRSQNRRSTPRYTTKPTLSFIITRSDLLGPTKDKVDALMPYFRDTLRSALYSADQNMRLGNVHLVSAKRGWWTKEIKEDIWERGGGNWMVGKFNVGKSNLFEVLFPKAAGERAPVYDQLVRQRASTRASEMLSESSLLPPAQPEVAFPSLPLVSSLPGTTASPIRLPFGNQKGELIDMPGLARGNLDQHVVADHRLDLVMTKRPRVEQLTIKPGQSLVLGGGLVRITPLLDPDDASTTMLAYPFVPIHAHVTSTEKAIAMQAQQRETSVKSILAPGAVATMSSAGTMELDTDVTKAHAGPLLRASDRLTASKLPFQVFSTDLVIEGVGWVELACQIRRRRGASSTGTSTSTSTTTTTTAFKPFTPEIAQFGRLAGGGRLPAFEVFTPEGKHVMKRRPLGAWMLWKEGNPKTKRMATAARPRRAQK